MSTTEILRDAARRLEEVAQHTVGGDWTTRGLLATRPEVVACHEGGATEHVAEARARSAPWIVTVSPAVAAPLVAWLRSTADAVEGDPSLPVAVVEDALAVARSLIGGSEATAAVPGRGSR